MQIRHLTVMRDRHSSNAGSYAVRMQERELREEEAVAHSHRFVAMSDLS
jgi:hypothetical protein